MNETSGIEIEQAVNTSASRIKLYSPTQAACGTIGGPVGLIYFLKANFEALGNENYAKKTVIYGAILIASLIALLPFLPNNTPSFPFTITYIIIARIVVEKYQMTKQAIIESTQYEFHSNWRVFGIGLLCLLCSCVVILLPIFLLSHFGIIE